MKALDPKSYRRTRRYEFLSNAMRVLLELVVVNSKEAPPSLDLKKRKVYLSYSDICSRLRGRMTKEDVSIAIDQLFDHQEISAKTIKRGGEWIRAYAPATELVQNAVTSLFILRPAENRE